MATVLDPEALAAGLTRLPGWSGDVSTIRATFALPAAAADRLQALVAAAADAANHHPQVVRTDTGIEFVLWTHSAGGVTDLDLALAGRINELAGELGR
ncbi:MAG: 4a-hydroxytetrahydrobiopterin dehydratase [Mycobacteriales bacterium]